MSKAELGGLTILLIVACASVALALPAKSFAGRPKFKARSALGAYVWQDTAGTHVRFTTKGLPRHFHGSVCSTKRITKVAPVLLEKKEYAKIGPKGHCVWFDFHTMGHIDGFDFRSVGRPLTFDFHMGKKQLPASNVHIGRHSVRPKNSPFVMGR